MTTTPGPAPRFSAFTDEAAVSLSGQARLARSAGLEALELRRIDGRPITRLGSRGNRRLAERLAANGLTASCVAAGLGKVPLATPLAAVADDLRRAAEVADAVRVRAVRVFSFRLGEADAIPSRARVLDRLAALLELAATLDVELWLENEKGTYATTAERTADLVAALDDPRLGVILDPANYVQCGDDPVRAYERLRSHVRHVHAKDALAASGRVARVGEGDANWPALRDALAEDRYAGFVAVEPHLGLGGRGGPTSPRAWRGAVEHARRLWTTEPVALRSQTP